MDKKPFQPKEVVDGIYSFPRGVNAGADAMLLPRDQLSGAMNTTVRGDFVTVRPKFKKIELAFSGYEPDIQSAFETGRFQEACVYNPDFGFDSLMASISGRLYRLSIVDDVATVTEETIPGDENDSTGRAWMIQAENYIINTDGTTKPPLIFDGVSTVRSLGKSVITLQAIVQNQFAVPPLSRTLINPIVIDKEFTGEVGTLLTVSPVGAFEVTAISADKKSLTVKNSSATPGATVKVGASLTWAQAGNQLPAGRQMAYGMGRIWMALTDGKQFVASDLVGGSSGTVANNFRDSILNMTENEYLLGGGSFTVPGTYGEITAMIFSETLDASLGQGPLQVFTAKSGFSCNAPVDRLTWQTMTNPILTESCKGGGAESQWSTVNFNADILMRSNIGIRSWRTARSEFGRWGNTTISKEVQPQMSRDSEDLLRFTSAVNFDNRYLLTSEGVLDDEHGVYFKRIVPINADQNSTMQSKNPSVYDAVYWTGLNVFKIVEGKFNNLTRCFAFTYNKLAEKIELWEILRTDDAAIYDNDETRVVWSMETLLDFQQKDPRARDRLRLQNGELHVDELRGTVDFQVYYRPDSWPCWVPWASWSECYENQDATTSPGFKPTMGLGEPSCKAMDEVNNRPLREGYVFHIKLVVTGHCKIKSGRFMAVTVPESDFPKPTSTPICQL